MLVSKMCLELKVKLASCERAFYSSLVLQDTSEWDLCVAQTETERGGGTTGEKRDALGCHAGAAIEGLLFGCWNEIRQTFQQGRLVRCTWKQRTGSRGWALANLPDIKLIIFLIQTSQPYRAFKLALQPACWPLTSARSIWRPCHRGRWTCRSLLPTAAERRCWRKRGAFASWQTNIACSLTKLATSMRR